MKRNYVFLLVLAMVIAAVGTSAKAQVLTFSGFQQPDEEILNYYNGGFGGSGTGPGPNYGIVFGSDALALPNGPSSNVANEPEGATGSMIFLSGAGDVMNVAAGFTTGFSFFYAAPGFTGSVEVFSGLNGTGTDLADLNLSTTAGNCDGFSQTYSCWVPIGVDFSGTAESVLFSGTANYIAFSDVTLGNSVPGNPSPAPEPSTLMMVGSGLAGLSGMMRRRFLKV